MIPGQLIDVNQCAARLRYSASYVRVLARDGTLPAIKRRQKWFFDPVKIDQWLESQINGGAHNGDGSISDL